jgi:hypothetical protein
VGSMPSPSTADESFVTWQCSCCHRQFESAPHVGPFVFCPYCRTAGFHPSTPGASADPDAMEPWSTKCHPLDGAKVRAAPGDWLHCIVCGTTFPF